MMEDDLILGALGVAVFLMVIAIVVACLITYRNQPIETCPPNMVMINDVHYDSVCVAGQPTLKEPAK